jgi:hypothetical protein
MMGDVIFQKESLFFQMFIDPFLQLQFDKVTNVRIQLAQTLLDQFSANKR